jgi:transcriptional regulator with XRE-family HTH domain
MHYPDMASDTSTEGLQEIGERLRKLRVAAGYANQVEYADALNISPQRYNHWERGRRLPDLWAIGRICSMTGATADWIFFGRVGAMPVDLMRRIASAS